MCLLVARLWGSPDRAAPWGPPLPQGIGTERGGDSPPHSPRAHWLLSSSATGIQIVRPSTQKWSAGPIQPVKGHPFQLKQPTAILWDLLNPLLSHCLSLSPHPFSLLTLLALKAGVYQGDPKTGLLSAALGCREGGKAQITDQADVLRKGPAVWSHAKLRLCAALRSVSSKGETEKGREITMDTWAEPLDASEPGEVGWLRVGHTGLAGNGLILTFLAKSIFSHVL
ncbi:hypothetical protein P4O66_019331 [Electrophorus voltai]|uniref:Uncharacterized protein n=1 Tax=Electrophorus voltai TaxID=2609070 RepID=A0AAD8ZU92_9TELE|nr:hypothetical protein P4O66_019331 [Electrophorus voltai]